MNLDEEFACPLHVSENVDLPVIKAQVRRALTKVGVGNRPWWGVVNVRAQLGCPDVQESLWGNDVIIFGIGVAPDEVDFPLRSETGIAVPSDVRDLHASESVIEDFGEVTVRVTDGGPEPEERLIRAIKTELMLRRGLEDVFDSLFVHRPEMKSRSTRNNEV
jgi:hypothetical protein